MNKFRFTLSTLAIAIFMFAFASIAQAQATRTWVSGVGDDVNPCSRTAPCKTFAGAISKTAANGEISVLDPGGFGSITITKSITIDGSHGAGFASILAAGTNGVNVSGSGIVVRLRSLSINGASTGVNGVRIITASKVFIEDCVIDGFTNRGITDERTVAGGQLFVSDSTIRNTTQSSIAIVPTGVGTITAMIDNVRIEFSGNSGVVIVGAGKATIQNTVAVNHVHGFFAQGTGAEMTLINCNSSYNTTNGIFVSSPAIVRLSNSTLTNNGASIVAGGVAQVSSAGNNVISGNTANNLPTGPPIPPS